MIDVHTHLWDSPEQLGAGGAEQWRRLHAEPWNRPEVSGTALERASAECQAAFVLGLVCERLSVNLPVQQVAAQVATQPERYLGFAGIDPTAADWPQRLDEALALGMRGVTVCPAGQGIAPTHDQMMRLLARCQDLGLPVVVHPGQQLGRGAMLELGLPHLLDPVGRAFPRLRVLIPELGHPWVEEMIVLLSRHRNFYADLSGLFRRPLQLHGALLSAWQQGVAGQLLLGSDFPAATAAEAADALYKINHIIKGTHLPAVPRAQLKAIVERDALACLGLRGSAEAIHETDLSHRE